MAARLDPLLNNYRSTDHSEEIALLRETAQIVTSGFDGTATVMRAAADLLEVHDATGISLDHWAGPRDLVNRALLMVGREPFLFNHI